jgi:hypothetical protein
MAPLEEESVTNHFVETASIGRRSRKVTRYHHQGKGAQRVMRQRRIGNPGSPDRLSCRRRRLGIRLIGRNETMRRVKAEEIVGHIGRNPLVRTSGAHLAGELGLVRDFT